jgi:hypothetical protein
VTGQAEEVVQQPDYDAGGEQDDRQSAPAWLSGRAPRTPSTTVGSLFKGQLDLELHGGCSLTGVTARVAQRLLALTAAIWHNRATGQPVTRSLIAYDH